MTEPVYPSKLTECARCERVYSGAICPECGLEPSASAQWNRCPQCQFSFRGTVCPECGLHMLKNQAVGGTNTPVSHTTAILLFFIAAALLSTLVYFVAGCSDMGASGIFVAIIAAQCVALFPITLVFLVLSFSPKGKGKFYRTIFYSNLGLLLISIVLGVLSEMIFTN